MINVVYISIGEGGSDKALFGLLKNIDRNIINPLVITNAYVQKGASEYLMQNHITFEKVKFDEDTWPIFLGLNHLPKYIYYLYRKLIRNLIAEKQILDIALKFDADLIHTNTGVLHLGFKVAKKLRIPHIWHIREYQDKDFNKTPICFRKSFLKKLKDNNNFIVFITKGLSDHFKIQNCAEVIYDGVLPKAAIRISYNKEKYFLYVGTLTENKGLIDLIDTFTLFSSKYSEYKLYIVGTGNRLFEKKLIDKIALANAKSKILLMGQRNDVYDLMYKATALIVPSKFEAFGLITAEAMFNGCLVIGRNTAGTKEQFDNGKNLTDKIIGLTFNNNTELLAELSGIATNGIELYNQVIECSQKSVLEFYTTEQHAENITKIYCSILSDKRNEE